MEDRKNGLITMKKRKRPGGRGGFMESYCWTVSRLSLSTASRTIAELMKQFKCWEADQTSVARPGRVATAKAIFDFRAAQSQVITSPTLDVNSLKRMQRHSRVILRMTT